MNKNASKRAIITETEESKTPASVFPKEYSRKLKLTNNDPQVPETISLYKLPQTVPKAVPIIICKLNPKKTNSKYVEEIPNIVKSGLSLLKKKYITIVTKFKKMVIR